MSILVTGHAWELCGLQLPTTVVIRMHLLPVNKIKEAAVVGVDDKPNVTTHYG